MGYTDIAGVFLRRGRWLLILKQDYCANTYGSAPCTASGIPYCYYTYPTCRDKANYVRGSKDYRLCMNEGGLVSDALPLVEKIKFVPWQIDFENFKTVRANLIVTMLDDTPHALANPDRSVSNAEAAGTFWRNWKARHDNYERRICELYRGFEGLDEGDWKLEFRGLLDSIEPLGDGKFRFTIKDLMRKLDTDSHTSQDEQSYLVSDYSGGATIYVSDASKFPAKIHGNYSYPEHEIVKVGANRYAKFSGRNTTNNTLTGAGWVYGSSGTASASEEVRQVIVYAGSAGYVPADANAPRIPPDWIFLDLFYRAGLDPSLVSDVDRGITLTAGISDVDMSIPVSEVNLPPEGIVRIGSELIAYSSVSESALSVKKRGAFGSTAASHNQDDPVKVISFTDELNKWISGYVNKRVVTDPLKIQDLLEDLCVSSMFYLFQDETMRLKGRAMTPPWWDESIPELTDDDLLDDSVKDDPNEDERRTRNVLHYLPLKNNPGEQTDDWQRSWWYLDADMEGDNYFGFSKTAKILAPFITHYIEGDAITARLQEIFSGRCEKIIFRTDIKTDLPLGSLIRLTIPEVVNPDGTPIQRMLMHVLSKVLIEDRDKSCYEYLARRFNMTHRFGIIAPEYPVLTSDITDTQTDIQVTISAATFQPGDILAEDGQIGIEDEVIDYGDYIIDDATHLTFHDCVRDGDKAAHSAGALVMILYTGASGSAREKYAFLGDADNELEEGEAGYVIY